MCNRTKIKENFDKTKCGTPQTLYSDYRGKMNKTNTGKTCQKWTSQYPHSHNRTNQNYPNSGVGHSGDDHNFCRNPDGSPDGAWCYTTDPNSRWEYCSVPTCKISNKICGKMSNKQKEYRGDENRTLTGLKCQKWTSERPPQNNRTNSNYPDTGLGHSGDDHNYCRNPDDAPLGAWCYTANNQEPGAKAKWDYCHVPNCETMIDCNNIQQMELEGNVYKQIKYSSEKKSSDPNFEIENEKNKCMEKCMSDQQCKGATFTPGERIHSCILLNKITKIKKRAKSNSCTKENVNDILSKFYDGGDLTIINFNVYAYWLFENKKYEGKYGSEMQTEIKSKKMGNLKIVSNEFNLDDFLEFDGKPNTYLNVIDDEPFDFPTDWTFSCLVHYKSFKRWSRIFDFGKDLNELYPQNQVCLTNIGTTNNLLFCIRLNNKPYSVIINNFFDLFRWINVTITFNIDHNNSNKVMVKIYKDGKNMKEQEIITDEKINLKNYTHCYFGKSNFKIDEYFHGNIAYPKFYLYAIDKSNISKLYKAYVCLIQDNKNIPIEKQKEDTLKKKYKYIKKYRKDQTYDTLDKCIDGCMDDPNCNCITYKSKNNDAYYSRKCTFHNKCEFKDDYSNNAPKSGKLIETPYTYVGCFRDTGNRDLPEYKGYNQNNTPDECSKKCAKSKYFGVQWRGECWCGDSDRKYEQNEGGCDLPCTGNSKLKCGAGWHNSVYTHDYIKFKEEKITRNIGYIKVEKPSEKQKIAEIIIPTNLHLLKKIIISGIFYNEGLNNTASIMLEIKSTRPNGPNKIREVQVISKSHVNHPNYQKEYFIPNTTFPELQQIKKNDRLILYIKSNNLNNVIKKVEGKAGWIIDDYKLIDINNNISYTEGNAGGSYFSKSCPNGHSIKNIKINPKGWSGRYSSIGSIHGINCTNGEFYPMNVGSNPYINNSSPYKEVSNLNYTFDNWLTYVNKAKFEIIYDSKNILENKKNVDVIVPSRRVSQIQLEREQKEHQEIIQNKHEEAETKIDKWRKAQNNNTISIQNRPVSGNRPWTNQLINKIIINKINIKKIIINGKWYDQGWGGTGNCRVLLEIVKKDTQQKIIKNITSINRNHSKYPNYTITYNIPDNKFPELTNLNTGDILNLYIWYPGWVGWSVRSDFSKINLIYDIENIAIEAKINMNSCLPNSDPIKDSVTCRRLTTGLNTVHHNRPLYFQANVHSDVKAGEYNPNAPNGCYYFKNHHGARFNKHSGSADSNMVPICKI